MSRTTLRIPSMNRGSTTTTTTTSRRPDAENFPNRGGSTSGQISGSSSYSYEQALQDDLGFGFLGDMLSSLPVIGSFFEPLKSMNDKQMAINHTGWEMEYNAREAEKNRQFQTSERLATQEWNEEMWNKQNEYNSLKSRLSRASEAGVNPNAILGEGDTSAQQPHASTPMSGATAHYSSSLANEMFQASANLAKTRAEVQNIAADTTNKEYEHDWNVMTETARHDLFINQANDYKASAELKGAEKLIAEGMYQIAKNKSIPELAILQQQLNNTRLQFVDMLKNIEYKDGQIKYIAQQTDNLEQEEMILNQQQRLNDFMIQYSSATGLPFGTDEFNACFYMYVTGQQDKYIQSRMLQSGTSPKVVENMLDTATDVLTPDGTTIINNGDKGSNKNSKKGKTGNKGKKKSKGNVIKRVLKALPFASAYTAIPAAGAVFGNIPIGKGTMADPTGIGKGTSTLTFPPTNW